MPLHYDVRVCRLIFKPEFAEQKGENNGYIDNRCITHRQDRTCSKATGKI